MSFREANKSSCSSLLPLCKADGKHKGWQDSITSFLKREEKGRTGGGVGVRLLEQKRLLGSKQ